MSIFIEHFRTPLATNWDGWLSEQTIITCHEQEGSPDSNPCFIIWSYEMVKELATEPEEKLLLDIGMKMQGYFIGAFYIFSGLSTTP